MQLIYYSENFKFQRVEFGPLKRKLSSIWTEFTYFITIGSLFNCTNAANQYISSIIFQEYFIKVKNLFLGSGSICKSIDSPMCFSF